MSHARSLAMAAVAAGLAYAVSPLTAWTVVAIALIVRRALRDLEGRERRWASAVLAIGLGMRLLAIAALILSTRPGSVNNPSFFGDGSYAIGRSLWLRSVFLREEIHPRFFLEALEPYGSGGHNYFHAILQTMLGPAPLALHLLTAAVFLGGVVILYRLTRASFGITPSLAVLAAAWLSPTWAAWSLTPIKDTLQFTLVVITIACVVQALHHRAWLRAGAMAGAVAAIAFLTTIREGTLVLMGATVAAGLLMAIVIRWKTIAVVVLAGLVFAAVIFGPMGAIRQRVSDELVAAANRHIGHFKTTGDSYMLLDEHLYYTGTPDTVVPTTAETLRFVISAAIAFIVVPLPWHVQSTTGSLYLPIQAVWYLAVALAFAGVRLAFARHPVLTAMLIVYVAVFIAIIAPNSGNVGTLVRHRDGIVPFVVCLSGIGATVVLGRSRLRAAALRKEYA